VRIYEQDACRYERCLPKVTDNTSVVDVTYDFMIGTLSTKFAMGTIEYGISGNLNSYYKTLVGADSPNADYMDTRIVGYDCCHCAINDFPAGKCLVKTE